MACITVSRQLGSLGCEVANAVAAKTGYQVVWRELINQAARRAGAPEVALAAIDELGMLGYRPSSVERQAYHQAIAQIMDELARQGEVVIVGRAGQVILKDQPGVLHVRVIAPHAVRVARVAQRMDISLEAATAQIETSDRNRRSYLRRYYRSQWDDETLYDLIVNTGYLSPNAAAELICKALTYRLQTLNPTPGTVPALDCE